MTGSLITSYLSRSYSKQLALVIYTQARGGNITKATSYFRRGADDKASSTLVSLSIMQINGLPLAVYLSVAKRAYRAVIVLETLERKTRREVLDRWICMHAQCMSSFSNANSLCHRYYLCEPIDTIKVGEYGSLQHCVTPIMNASESFGPTSNPAANHPAETAASSSSIASDLKTDTLAFRAPSTSPASSAATASTSEPWPVPPLTFLTCTWHVTHSTLPMWKSNKNVAITYTALPSTSPDSPPQLDDLVAYNSLSDSSNPPKQKTVRGVDTPFVSTPAAYDWRGRGWLKIASSHWEVLGWGEEDGGWVVTYFAKTLFTPAGIDVYARRKGGISDGLLERVKEAMRQVQDEAFGKLAGEIFEIKHEW
jgi:hypothetical protein